MDDAKETLDENAPDESGEESTLAEGKAKPKVPIEDWVTEAPHGAAWALRAFLPIRPDDDS